MLLVPLGGALALLPLLGMMLNGTSSVLYGSVPDFAAEGARPRASSADAEETGNRSDRGDHPVVLIKQQRVNRADGLASECLRGPRLHVARTTRLRIALEMWRDP
jgi:hypothetical protein